MKKLLISLLIASTFISGCVVYPRPIYSTTVDGTIIYEGVEYYYDPAPAYVAGEVAIGLYFIDRFGVRHYHYVPRNHWRGPYPVIRPRH